MDAVPTYGHAGRIKAAEDAYQSQVDSARRARAATQMDAATSRAMEADRAAREAARSRVEKLGTPTSTFRSGAYESRTYQSGNTIQTIRMKNGKITGSSTYRTNR